MNITTGSHPVRHLVVDNFVAPAAEWSVPPPEWAGWEVHYDSPFESGKRASRVMTPWASEVLRRMQDLDVMRACGQLFGTAMFPDTLLYGGGLQVTAPGGELGCHLDAAVHNLRPHLRRAVQVICFCHPRWEVGHGGQFAFFSPNGTVVQTFDPLPGRLVAFEACHDLSYHGTLPTAADAPERVSVCYSLLTEVRACDTRRRALFMPGRRQGNGSPPDARAGYAAPR